jgi:hypothetical protein
MNALKPAEDIDSGSLVLIREILVTHVGMDYRPMIKKKKISPPRPERVGDQTWRVTYTVFLNCPTPNRIKVCSVNKVWQSDDPARVMMERVRSSIKDKAKEYSIDCDSGLAKYYMLNLSPWEYLWAKAENDIMTQKQEFLKQASRITDGHERRMNALKSSG